MKNLNLLAALTDLCSAIYAVTLGSVEQAVIMDAGKSLITNWNDHNTDDQIDVELELKNWEDEITNSDIQIIVKQKECCGNCVCGKQH